MLKLLLLDLSEMRELIVFKPLAPLDARISLCLLFRVPEPHRHYLVVVVDYLTLVHLVARHIEVVEGLLGLRNQCGCDVGLLGVSIGGCKQGLREGLH